MKRFDKDSTVKVEKGSVLLDPEEFEDWNKARISAIRISEIFHDLNSETSSKQSEEGVGQHG